MSTALIAEYSQLINKEHDMYGELFKTAMRFDVILANFYGLRTSESHTAFAKTLLANYEKCQQQLEQVLMEFSEEFYRGLKREKKERRQRIFICAYKCCLSGAFYSKNQLIQAANRDILKCENPVPLDEVVALLQKAFIAKLGVEYRFADELLQFDYYAMQLALEFCECESVETRFIERLKQKGVEIPATYEIAQLMWQYLPDMEQAINAVIRKDYADEVQKAVEKYTQAGMENVSPAYIARTCYLVYLLQLRGWNVRYGSENEILLVHDNQVVHEYL